MHCCILGAVASLKERPPRSAPHLRKSARLAAIDRSWPFGRSVSVNSQVSAWAAVSMPPRINRVPSNFRFIAHLHLAWPSRMGRGQVADGSSRAGYKLDRKGVIPGDLGHQFQHMELPVIGVRVDIDRFWRLVDRALVTFEPPKGGLAKA